MLKILQFERVSYFGHVYHVKSFLVIVVFIIPTPKFKNKISETQDTSQDSQPTSDLLP